jgi:Tfp pilus assembly PilM family ATPase
MSLFSMDLFKPTFPWQAMEISGGKILGVSLEKTKAEVLLKHFFCEDIPDGVLDLAMITDNISQVEAFKTFLEPRLKCFTDKKRRVSLLLPDIIAKVSIFDFEKLPAKREEITELVKWKLKKAMPFDTEEAKIVYKKLTSVDGAETKTSLLVAVIKSTILEQYERIFEDFHFNAGLIDLSSFNLVNLCGFLNPAMARDARNYLILNVAETYYTMNIIRRGSMIFYRAKSVRETGVSFEKDLIHLIEKDFMPTILYFRERLKGGEIEKILLRNYHYQDGALKTFLEDRYSMPVEYIEPGKAVKNQADPEPDYSDFQKMAPLIGVVLAR